MEPLSAESWTRQSIGYYLTVGKVQLPSMHCGSAVKVLEKAELTPRDVLTQHRIVNSFECLKRHHECSVEMRPPLFEPVYVDANNAQGDPETIDVLVNTRLTAKCAAKHRE
ncbi:hypothetical protein T265_02119 [Opisthorchis viverrini]|uniref:Uncharacterized protein n=1 Tax=Opisthorchis viverrini TaxID=6198 RepID=A0A075AIJ8_OPIVI|nr:hypothetical protein T265_02119 [Opisthorchis viverrini]KER31759.1 hypothetical protein T265_02119 [Opisthorchis viverrini]